MLAFYMYVTVDSSEVCIGYLLPGAEFLVGS